MPSPASCSCSVAGAGIGSSCCGGMGMDCLLAKRLERGKFVWPQAQDGTVHLSPAQLSMLLEGIDWRRPQRTHPPQLSV